MTAKERIIEKKKKEEDAYQKIRDKIESDRRYSINLFIEGFMDEVEKMIDEGKAQYSTNKAQYSTNNAKYSLSSSTGAYAGAPPTLEADTYYIDVLSQHLCKSFSMLSDIEIPRQPYDAYYVYDKILEMHQKALDKLALSPQLISDVGVGRIRLICL